MRAKISKKWKYAAFFSIFVAMKPQLIDGVLFLSMLRQGAAVLERNKASINDLNVFPIPDGDTGDNMYMTLSAGCNAEPDRDISKTSSAASSGMLLGARGNSGVILSRIFAGMAKALAGKTEIAAADFGDVMAAAVKEAYGVVSNPVEGTILTVLKDGASVSPGFTSFEDLFQTVIVRMEESLEHTPELLPVLKEAGVVDSGGAGLVCIFKGMYEALCGTVDEYTGSGDGVQAQKAALNLDAFGPDAVMEFGYCTEFLLRLQTSKVDLQTFDESIIKDYLNSVGESVVCFRDGSIVKAHVHTKTPGEILSACQKWGEFLTLKIENMTLQHNEVNTRETFLTRRKPYGVVTVASGEGLVNALREAGADIVIEGGQTMNPSTEDFVSAFKSVNADVIFVLPNNSNIIMTAQQAAGIYTDSKVIVLPSKTLGAGYVCIASMDLSMKDPAEIEVAAKETIDGVVTGMVSRAVRDSSQDGVNVRSGEYIGFEHNRILCCAPNAGQAACQLAAALDLGSHDVALVFGGRDASEPEKLVSALTESFPRTEIIMTDGGQPVYDYIIVLC